MKVGGNLSLVPAAPASALRGARGAALDATSATGDRLEISGRAREIDAAKDAIAQLPEVREDRVAALKAQLATGSYSVPAEAVAAKLQSALGQ